MTFWLLVGLVVVGVWVFAWALCRSAFLADQQMQRQEQERRR